MLGGRAGAAETVAVPARRVSLHQDEREVLGPAGPRPWSLANTKRKSVKLMTGVRGCRWLCDNSPQGLEDRGSVGAGGLQACEVLPVEDGHWLDDGEKSSGEGIVLCLSHSQFNFNG